MSDADKSRRRGKSGQKNTQPKVNIPLFALFPEFPAKFVSVIYTNHRGETGKRTIQPMNLYWGSNDWHPEPQWLMDGIDLEKQAIRTFAIKDMRPI